MLIKRFYAAGHPSFYWLKSCVGKKITHSPCSAVNAEICAGTDPFNLFEKSHLQYKLTEYMLKKRCCAIGHPSFYQLKKCGDRKMTYSPRSEVNAEICAGTGPLNLFL